MFTKILQYILIIFVIFILAFQTLIAQEQSENYIKRGLWKGKIIQYWKGQLLVKIKQDVSIESLKNSFSQYQAQLKGDLNKHRWGLLEVSLDADIFQKIEQLKNHPLIESITPSPVYRTSAYPNDPEYVAGKQWALYNHGQDPPSGTDDADIDMPEAWGVTKGSSQVVIAILDSGIPMKNGSLSHPDLKSSSKIILGPDYIILDTRSPHETDPSVKDECGHGTHVAGIVAAKTNNHIGVAGVAHICKLLIIRRP